ACQRHRCRDRARPPEAHLPARRQDRALWRADAGDEPVAVGGLPQAGAGRPGGRKPSTRAGPWRRTGSAGNATMMLTADLLEPHRTRLGRWAVAALFVVAAHAGFTAMALWHWPDDEADDSAASSVIVEMVPAPAIRPVDSPDVAHGPLMEEAMLTPQ